MQRIGFVMTVREGYEEEYRIRHEMVYPELLAAFTRLGVSNYSIFMHGRTLFAYMTVDRDYQETMEELANDPSNRSWQAYMADIMEPWQNDEIMKVIPEVFFFA